MRDVLFRLGQVCWWLGTSLAVAQVALLALWMFRDAPSGLKIAHIVLLAAAMVALIGWALAFVLAGSFWRPPRRPA